MSTLAVQNFGVEEKPRLPVRVFFSDSTLAPAAIIARFLNRLARGQRHGQEDALLKTYRKRLDAPHAKR